MSSDNHTPQFTPLDLSKWRKVPWTLIAAGAIGAIGGAAMSGNTVKAFRFFLAAGFHVILSLAWAGGSSIMFDASWVPCPSRGNQSMACLLCPAFVDPLPARGLSRAQNLSVAGTRGTRWSQYTLSAPSFPCSPRRAITLRRRPLFAVWWFFSNRLRYWSLQQDQTGSASCTGQMRVYSCLGIVCFALSLTLAPDNNLGLRVRAGTSVHPAIMHLHGTLLAAVLKRAASLSQKGKIDD